jgi:error-prone DNA polymerase
MALLRPQLSLTRCDDSGTMARVRSGQRVRVPGLVLMRQRPMTAKGVIFVTIEDEHGHANVVVYAHVSERDRATLIGGRLLVVEGRVQREDEHSEVPIIHLIARRLIDRSDLLDTLAHIDGKEDGAWAERGLGRPNEVKRPAPGSQRVKMPPTRDFR